MKQASVPEQARGRVRDVILSSDFNLLTWRGLERFVEDTIDPVPEEILHGPLETWAYLWFRLRAAEDRAEWFPSGKWATVQRLEQLLDETVSRATGELT